MLLSVYITRVSAERDVVSLSLEARNMHTVANSWSLFRLSSRYVARNLSMKFTASGKTSSSHRCSSQTCKKDEIQHGLVCWKTPHTVHFTVFTSQNGIPYIKSYNSDNNTIGILLYTVIYIVHLLPYHSLARYRAWGKRPCHALPNDCYQKGHQLKQIYAVPL